MNTLDPQIKEIVVELSDLQSVLHRLGAAGDVAEIILDLVTAILKVLDH